MLFIVHVQDDEDHLSRTPMIQQHVIDTLADDLVEKGTLVSTSTIQAALKRRKRPPGEPEGKGVSNRDLKDPLADWKRRRRYKGHLATLDLPEEMEKAIAAFAGRAMAVAEQRATEAREPAPEFIAVLGHMQRLIDRLEEQLADLAKENRALSEDLVLARAMATPRPGVIEGTRRVVDTARKSTGRKNGVVGSTSRHFWARLVRELAAVIRRSGPMTAQELCAVIDDETKALADLAFEPIGDVMLVEKLKYRLNKSKPVWVLKGDRYHIKRGRTSSENTAMRSEAA